MRSISRFFSSFHLDNTRINLAIDCAIKEGDEIYLYDCGSMNRILFLSVVYFFWNKGGILPKHAGAYKGEKRRKELSRQKKQEERRQRRFQKGDRTPSDAEKVEQEETKPTNP